MTFKYNFVGIYIDDTIGQAVENLTSLWTSSFTTLFGVCMYVLKFA